MNAPFYIVFNSAFKDNWISPTTNKLADSCKN